MTPSNFHKFVAACGFTAFVVFAVASALFFKDCNFVMSSTNFIFAALNLYSVLRLLESIYK